MKFLALLAITFIAIRLYLALLRWLAENLILPANLIIAALAAFALIFGICTPISRRLRLR